VSHDIGELILLLREGRHEFGDPLPTLLQRERRPGREGIPCRLECRLRLFRAGGVDLANGLTGARANHGDHSPCTLYQLAIDVLLHREHVSLLALDLVPLHPDVDL